MHSKASRVVAAGALISLVNATGLAAQSLADVARQEEERRKAVAVPSKILTNDDLRSVPVFTPPAAPSGSEVPDALAVASEDSTPAPGKASDTGTAEGSEPARADADTDDGVKDQADWSGRFKGLQTQLERNVTFATALQSRINALANDYTNQADPIQQAALATERQRAISELNRVTKEIDEGRRAIADLQEEARRAGVPAGWLR